MAEIKFEIKEKIAELSKTEKGWTKELNLISWNDKEAQYDIRKRNPEHTKMSKGITLTKEEMKVLKETLNIIK